MKKALEFWRQLDAGEVKNRAELAQGEGITRTRVTQIVKLLRLARAIQEAILVLPVGNPERLVTERKLRNLAGLGPEDQREAFKTMVGDALERPSGGRKVG